MISKIKILAPQKLLENFGKLFVKSVNGIAPDANGNVVVSGGGGGGAVDSVNGKTGVVVLATEDIGESENKNYVTDAEKTVISNTSGTNTGDQDLSGLQPKITIADGNIVVGGANDTLVDSNYNIRLIIE